MSKVQPVGVSNSKVSPMLWPNAQRRLSSSLKSKCMTILVGIPVRSAISGCECTFSPQSNGRTAEDRWLQDSETPFCFNNIGELINESEIVFHAKGSAGLSVKGRDSEKNGIPACLFAAEAVTTGGASLAGQSLMRGRLCSSIHVE